MGARTLEWKDNYPQVTLICGCVNVFAGMKCCVYGILRMIIKGVGNFEKKLHRCRNIFIVLCRDNCRVSILFSGIRNYYDVHAVGREL